MLRLNVRYGLYVVTLFVGLTACGDVKDAAQKAKESTQIIADGATKSTENIAAAAKDLKEGMASVAGVDPLGIKTVLKEKESLTEYSKRLEAEISQLRASPGVVSVTSADRLRLEILGVSGTMYLDGWTDSRENRWIARDLFGNRGYKSASDALGVTFDVANRTLLQWAVAKYDSFGWGAQNGINGPEDKWAVLAKPAGGVGNANWQFAEMLYPRLRTDLDAAYKIELDNKLTAFLQAPFSSPSTPGVGKNYDIDVGILKEGPHSLYLAITPVIVDIDKKWQIRYRLITYKEQTKDQTLRVIVEGRVDSEDPKLVEARDANGNAKVAVELSPIKIAYFNVGFPNKSGQK